MMQRTELWSVSLNQDMHLIPMPEGIRQTDYIQTFHLARKMISLLLVTSLPLQCVDKISSCLLATNCFLSPSLESVTRCPPPSAASLHPTVPDPLMSPSSFSEAQSPRPNCVMCDTPIWGIQQHTGPIRQPARTA